jgi:RNA polymerase sigma-70 factor (ECF subfamily)
MTQYTSIQSSRPFSAEEISVLVEQAKKGDEVSLRQLCEYVYAKIYSYMVYRVHRPEDAEDLTSEVVLRVAKALSKQRGHFHAWIYRIAKYALIDFYRKRAVRKELSLAEMPVEIADERVDFARQALTRERLNQAMQQLTEEQQQVIQLRFIEGYENAEVAGIMAKSVGAVKLLQFRALRSMRNYFRKKGYEIKD